MKKYIEKQFESGEVYIESTSHGYPIWWREFKEIVNEANTLSDINSCLMYSKTPFRLLPMLVNNIPVFNPFIFDFLTNNPNYLQCFYDGHIKGKKEFEETYFIKYPNEQQTKVITRKFNDDFKKTILFGQGYFNESNVTMAGFQNGILTAYWLFEDSFLENKPINESPFSVLEWATIFYYADETKLLPESRTINARIEQFINKYEINTTIKYFRTQYYEAKKRINEKNDYPINKLELIIPFLKENYKQTVTKVENDIIFLEDNMPEY